MKKILFISTLFTSALFLSSCDHEYNYPGLEDAALPTNKLTVGYALTDADYATVTSSKVNVGLLDKKSPTYKVDSTSLASIGKNKYFADADQAHKYLPAFNSTRWYSASEGSAVKVTYKRSNSLANLFAMTSLTYTVSDADYASVWGNSLTKSFSSKNSAIDNIPKILLTAFPTALKNNFVQVTYNESTLDPTDAAPNPKFSAISSLFVYDGTKWILYANKVEQYSLIAADYTAMGNTYNNFQGTQQDSYIPLFLKNKYPYAQDGDIKSIVYLYNSSPKTTRADVYKLLSGVWTKLNVSIEEVTDQFVYSSGIWKYNPSVVIDLKPTKQPEVTAFYQLIVDFVKNNKGITYCEYDKKSSTQRTNAEYYYGISAYYTNISFSISSWRDGCLEGPKAYAGYDDKALTDLMYKRLPEAFIPALEKKYPDATPIDGVSITYTINFALFTGTTLNDCSHTIVYKVVGKGKFEYVKDSFQPIK